MRRDVASEAAKENKLEHDGESRSIGDPPFVGQRTNRSQKKELSELEDGAENKYADHLLNT